MDKDEFALALKDTHALLLALARLIPKYVPPELTTYLDRLADDPAGREVLRAAIKAPD